MGLFWSHFGKSVLYFLYLYNLQVFASTYLNSLLMGYLAHFPAPASKFFLIKVFYIFSKKRFFLYFRNWNFLAPSLKKLLYFLASTLKMFPWKNFLYFFLKKIPLKKFIFSQKKLFLYFRKRNFLIIQETECSSPKTKKFKEGNFWARKLKKTALIKFLIFW